MNSDGTRVIVGAYLGARRMELLTLVLLTSIPIIAMLVTWDERKLVSPDNETSAQFGWSVSMNSDGTKVIVGAFMDDEGASDTGAAYIFTYSGGSWDVGTKIVAPDKAQDDRFGSSVAMSGNGTKVIVGAYMEDHNVAGGVTLTSAGSAYIYTYDGSNWDTGTKIVASDRAANDLFGRTVAINSDGTKVIVGASGDTGVGGEAAYIFTYNGSSWVQQQILVASDGAEDDRFGFDVAMSGDGTKVIVGAYLNHADSLSDAGAAYIYTYNGSSWDTGTKIVAPDKAQDDRYGFSVGMSSDGTRVIVGAFLENAGALIDTGSAYIYTYDGSNWDTGTKISAPVGDRTANDYFGYSVAMNSDGKKVIVGAQLADPGGLSSAGFAHVFTRDTTHHLMTDLKLQSNTWHNLTYAYQGEGGSRVTYLDGRKVAEDQAEDTFGDYPPFAMTGYSQGGYVVSASSEYLTDARLAWRAFDGNSANEGSPPNVWQTNLNTYDTSGDFGIASGNTTKGTFTADGVTYIGEWIKLEIPHKFILNNLKWESSIDNRRPKKGAILGSNDDVNWYTIRAFNNDLSWTTNSAADYAHITSNSNSAYKYVMAVIEQVQGGDGNLWGNGISLYGHRENDLVRLPDPTNVLKYPHIAMTGPGQRGYVASASDFNTLYPPWEAFDDKYTSLNDGVNDHQYMRWQPNGGRYTDPGSGPWTPTTSLTDNITTLASGSSPASYTGDWLQLESPNKLNIKSYRVYNSTDYVSEHNAHTVVLLGSNTGNNDWVDIGSGETVLSWSLTSDTSSNHQSTVAIASTSGNTGFYKYHRLIVRKVTDQQLPVIYQLQLYGTGVDSIPLQIGGGNIDKVANFRVYDKFVGEDQALEIWDAQKDEFGRAKSSMTLQKGRLGIGTTEPEGRLAVADEPDPTTYGLQKFPPRGMSGYKTYLEGHGEFCVSASSQYGSSFAPWRAFRDTNDYDNDIWVAGNNEWYTSNGNPSVLHYLADNTPSGAWLKIEMPYKIKLNSFSFVTGTRNYSIETFPENFQIWASNNGTEWNQIYSVSGFGNPPNETGGTIWGHTNVNSQTYYSMYAMVITKLYMVGSNTRAFVSIPRWKLFGYREQVTKQSVLHDGQLTLTKNLTVPRIGPALDADDTPRRDRLVVEYNTSTNPTFEGAVRDTSGRGNDGVFVGTATYDANEKAFTFPGSGMNTIQKYNLGPDLKGNQQLTVSLWFKPNLDEDQNLFGILPGDRDEGGSPSTENKVFGVRTESDATDYNLLFYYWNSDYRYNVPELDSPRGKWFHLVVMNVGGTKTGSGTTFDRGDPSNRRLFLNGVELFTPSSTTFAQAVTGDTNLLDLDPNSRLIIGARYANNGELPLDGSISQFKLYDTALTAEEVKTLYDMGRCDEGHHVVNFSKTRVGIGLGDGEAPRSTLDVRGGIAIGQTTGQVGPLHIKFNSNRSRNTGTRFEDAASTNYWENWINNGDFFYFAYNGSDRGWIQGPGGPGATKMPNFTGQHMTFIKDVSFSQASDLEGLIVSSDQNKYIKMSGGIEAGSNAITTNESLPVVSLSNVATDKKCFGVISASEDPETRTVLYGAWGSVAEKEKGDTRVYINSVGEGAIWVSNIGGNLEAGDYITTSNVAGYGQKQDDDVLHNYTVAKITMDCDFNPATQPVQQILRSNVIQTYYLGNVHKVKSLFPTSS
jgi:hypothetical protein